MQKGRGRLLFLLADVMLLFLLLFTSFSINGVVNEDWTFPSVIVAHVEDFNPR